MTRIQTLTAAAIAALTLTLGACTTDPVVPTVSDDDIEVPAPTPTPDPDSTATPGPSGSASQATVLERNSPLAQDEVVTRTIGVLGGIIRLPQAGLTVVVPPLALDSQTQITVTAPAGNLVGYHFAPHGLEFAVPLIVTQDLTNTLFQGLTGLRAVYFDGELAPSVDPLEELTLDLLGLLGTFQVHHFSGYVIATN